ncbi:MAG: hypothetical protein QOH93_3690, partial [Chloroflexia bacterium]|nr:hypothetical protein [Chloroflexia bacterium]
MCYYLGTCHTQLLWPVKGSCHVRSASLSNIDLPLILCTLLAAALGIIMVFSATNTSGAAAFQFNSFVTRQMIYAGSGILLMIVIAR